MLVDKNGSLVNIPGSVGVDYEISEEEIGDRDLSSVLTIIDSQPSDAGQYMCVARNDVTSIQESATLTVHGMCVWSTIFWYF